jgi:acyl-CoA thioester hydrolase
MQYDFDSYTYKHKTNIQIRFNDIDMLRHVNNTVYQNYFDSARFDYFKDVIGVNKFRDNEWVVLATITIDYITPIFREDTLTVYTKITKIGSKSLTMLQRIYAIDKNGYSCLRTNTSSVLVAYDLINERPIHIPEKWKQRIAIFEQDCEIK